VADNGDFDLDATAGSVIDPVAVATNAATEPKSGGSSSGCNGGFGALALLALAVLPFIRREKR
ncbi:Synerg-CTERM sorting domain-containing protein, partial [Cloacibacillus evryensis]